MRPREYRMLSFMRCLPVTQVFNSSKTYEDLDACSVHFVSLVMKCSLKQDEILTPDAVELLVYVLKYKM